MAEVRLIDANKIYDAVERRYQVSSGIEHRCERDLLDLICAAPTISPDSLRPKGRWVEHYDEERDIWHYGCPFCEDGYATRTKHLQNFCPPLHKF